jgi:hypothetical protein
MHKAAKLRWTVLLSALAATFIAIAYPVEDVAVPVQNMSLVEPSNAPPEVAAAAALTAPRVWIATDENPFAARAWDAPPPVIQAPPTAAAPEQVLPVTQQTSPLPYRFLGRMQDGDDKLVYLGRGEQVLLAHQGDVLDGAYKVVSLEDSQIEFESIQGGMRQTLPIPAQ